MSLICGLCEERSEEAIREFAALSPDCFAALSMNPYRKSLICFVYL